MNICLLGMIEQMICCVGCMLVRISSSIAGLLLMDFTGFLHPIIHLGFGVEFQQPAIIAEALAQAAVHTNCKC